MSLDPTEIIKAGTELAAPLTATLSDAWSAIIGDRIAAWRLQNAAKLQQEVNLELQKLGVKLDNARIPERYAFAWFEEGSKQDEPEIQSLFARLLARAANGVEEALDRRHIEIISRLTPIDALVLRFIYDNAGERRQIDLFGKPFQGAKYEEPYLYHLLSKRFGENSKQSVEHLIVLGVLEVRPSVDRWSLSRVFGAARVQDDGELDLPTFSADLDVGGEVHMTFTGQALSRALDLESLRAPEAPSSSPTADGIW